MSDIEDELRNWAGAQTNHGQLMREAADEIGRLRSLLANSEMTVREVMADNERLRAREAELVAALRLCLPVMLDDVLECGPRDDGKDEIARAAARAALAKVEGK